MFRNMRYLKHLYTFLNRCSIKLYIPNTSHINICLLRTVHMILQIVKTYVDSFLLVWLEYSVV